MRSFKFVLSALVLFGAQAQAQNLVKNGGFELATNPTTHQQINPNISYLIKYEPTNQYRGAELTNWDTNGFAAFLEAPGKADSQLTIATVSGELSSGYYIRGPKNGVANGMPDTSPTGGYYYAVDPHINSKDITLSQTITGLQPGQDYTLSYYWAAGVLNTYFADASFTSGWSVTLADSSNPSVKDVNLTTMSNTFNQNQFVAWTQTSISFTASASSELLTFIPTGTGSPPMSLLDGISITPTSPVPEPATILSFSGGLLALVLQQRRRKQQAC